MGDLVGFRPGAKRAAAARGFTAAARILANTRVDEPHPEGWHQEAWGYRNTVGEVRYAEMWLGNGMARARLVAATREAPGAEPVPLPETHPASQYMALLAGGVGGQAALLRNFATYLLTPGVGYLCGADPQDGGGPTWSVRSAEEVRLSTRFTREDGSPMYEVACGDDVMDWEALGEGGLVVKVHRPDPQRSWRSDSPVRGALPILHELVLLTQAIEAQATSRLAGAGILPLPAEMVLPAPPADAPEGMDSWEYWVRQLIKNVTTPIKDRGSAAAHVPFPMRIPGEFLGKLQRLDFFTPFDEHALDLRVELIHRLGTAMDMPLQALTGDQENHWGKAQTAEEGLRLHVGPNLELVCDAVTKGYLRPALARDSEELLGLTDVPAEGRLLAEAQLAEALVPVDQAGNEIIAWYELEAVRMDRSEDAIQAHDRLTINDASLNAELGLSDAEAPDDPELERRVWLKVVESGGDAGLVGLALQKLGLVQEDELPATVTSPAGTPPPAAGEAPAPGVGAEPATAPEAPAPSEQPPAAPAAAAAAIATAREAAQEVALVAACDGIVHRALEKAGNRMRQQLRDRRGNLPPGLDATPTLMHTVAAVPRPLERLLADAWDRVPGVAGNLGVDATALAQFLDGYTRALLTAGEAHTWDALASALANWQATPASKVLALTARSNGHG